ncbi:MAG: ATP-binding protein [Oscillospiraceae bacterium]|nr:ATP-binding protein [Oscillospiraceae bacterium]
MDYTLIRRNVESILRDTLSDTPVAVLQGARQVGKSTLTQMVSKDVKSMSVTLDSEDVLMAAKGNTYEFISQFPEGLLIIDEVQRCPELLTAIKMSVDRDRRVGRFLLTGSANLLTLRDANESLAGRAETIILQPFSVGEKMGIKEDFAGNLLSRDILPYLRGATPLTRADYVKLIIDGGYPDAQHRSGKRKGAYFRNYINRVLDHDAAELSGLSHIDRMQQIYKILAGNSSQIYVRANMSRLIGIPESSMNGYIHLLDDLCLLNTLPAWGNNYSRRAIKKPKIVLTDTGIVCSLMGINYEFLADIKNGTALGPLLETFVINEIIKQQAWSSADFSLLHYRDSDNKEVDLILEFIDGRVIAIEIKAASSVSKSDFSGLKTLRNILGERFYCGILLYTGTDVLPFGDNLFVAPISAVWEVAG